MPEPKLFKNAIQEAKYKARERRERRQEKPQPFIVLKLTILISSAIIGYASYVYIGRLCIGLIERRRVALGVGLMVGYAILLGMTLWSYLKVVITPPGKACDYVPKAPRPQPTYSAPRPSSYATNDPLQTEFRSVRYEDTFTNGDVNTSPLGAITGNREQLREDLPRERPVAPPPPGTYSDKAAVLVNEREIRRLPPTTPQLLPEFRYCTREGLVKPYRAHHCRACGTCVLKYDHHCPWIGQCVGARNHKFFVIFNFWTCLYTAYIFSSLLARVIQDGNYDLDPQYIVVIALAAIFMLFTASLFSTHVSLILLNQTTVEHLAVRDQKERERAQFHHIDLGCFGIRERRRIMAQLDHKWGRIGKEGNIWWKDGGARANWEEVMGPGWFQWMFPIWGSPSDGLSYEPNRRRFDELGRWKPKVEWTG